jgi:dTMP kinase
MHGKFIVLEGIDGCGKGTQAKVLASWLFDKDKKNTVVLTRNPYRLVDDIRSVLKSSKSPTEKKQELTNLFIKDRKLCLAECIEPNLRLGHHVICDRYKHSTIVYQSCQGVDVNKLVSLHEGMLVPHLTIVIDVPAEVGLERLQKDSKERRPNQEMFEKLEFMKKLAEGYKHLPKLLPSEKIVFVDGNREPQEVFKDVQSAVQKTLV